MNNTPEVVVVAVPLDKPPAPRANENGVNWKRVVTVTLIIVAVAIAVYLGAKYVLPRVWQAVKDIPPYALSRWEEPPTGHSTLNTAVDAVLSTGKAATAKEASHLLTKSPLGQATMTPARATAMSATSKSAMQVTEFTALEVTAPKAAPFTATAASSTMQTLSKFSTLISVLSTIAIICVSL